MRFSSRNDAGRNRSPRARMADVRVERVEERMMLSTLSLISGNAAGIPFNGDTTLPQAGSYGTVTPAGRSGSFSADGSRMLFTSTATNLVANPDTNQTSDVYVRDIPTGKVSLVSVTPDGKASNGQTFGAVLSPNGRYVTFQSQATDLMPLSATTPDNSYGGFGGTPLTYLRDLATGTTTLLEATPDGQPSSEVSYGGQVVFSPDGRSLAFTSTATDLTETPAEIPPAQPVDPSDPSMETDPSMPVDLPMPIFPPSPSYTVIYLRDLASGATSVVNLTRDGKIPAPPGGSSGYSAGDGQLVFSPDGRKLAFLSSATNLTADGVPDARPDDSGTLVPYSGTNLFVHDLDTRTTSLVSVSTDGKLGQGGLSFPGSSDYNGAAVFSPDGKKIAFVSSATNLTSDSVPSSGASPYSGTNLYLRDLAAGTTTLVTRSISGGLSSVQPTAEDEGSPRTPYATLAVFSPDGRWLAFDSSATDLTNDPLASSSTASVPGNMGWSSTNLFVADLASGAIRAVTLNTDGQLLNGANLVGYGLGSSPSFSPDSQSLLFVSEAEGLTALPTDPLNTGLSYDYPSGDLGRIYLRDLRTHTTRPISVTVDGKVAGGSNPVFSPDGKSIAFTSASTSLTTNPPDLQYNVAMVKPSSAFLHDLTTGKTTLLSASVDGLLSNNLTGPPLFSPDGQTVYFSSAASNLVPVDRNGSQDLFAVSLADAPPVASPVVTPQPTAVTPSPVALAASSPQVGSSIRLMRIERTRGRSSRLVVTLSGAIDPATASDPSHYAVIVPGRSKGRQGPFAGRILGVKSVSYNAATHTASLTLHHGRKPQKSSRILFM